MNLVDLIFTNDGREYLTPQHLIREIHDELIVHGGKVALTDLVPILNVDLNHIEDKAKELVTSSDGDITLVMGQLINTDYKDEMAEEINERLQQHGTITIPDLQKFYNLPADFIHTLIYERIGLQIKGQPDKHDPNVLFTQAYLAEYKARISGVMRAVTRPISLKSVSDRFKFPSRLFQG